MGALCGKEEPHFTGQGHTLAGGNNAAALKAPTQTKAPAPTPAPIARPLGGSGPSPDPNDREARARAAEQRAQAASSRGTAQGGKIASALAAQSADGGRAKDAVLQGANRDAPLVYD